jgi:multidrug efflux pump subunit AcrB
VRSFEHIPGQFAVTVAFSMLLSAMNALTLSPALCPHHGPRRGPMGYVMRGIDHIRDQTRRGVKTANGKRWHAMQIIRLRDRLGL